MNTTEPCYCINGEEPQLVGQRCTAFLVEHFYEDLQITNEVNVAHLCFEEQCEPPRVSRRLKSLRGLSHEQVEQVLTRGA